MAEKEQQQFYTAPQNNPYGRVDEEVADVAAKDLRRKKRMKCFAYIVAFAVFQIAIIMLFSLTVMKFKSPKFRVRSATVETFTAGTPASPSSNLRMIAEIGVKNTNFGQFKYDNTTIDFYYRGTKVGEAIVLKAKAKARSTRKFNVTVDLTSTNSELGNDIASGVVPLSSESRLRGKVEIMKMMKKNKSAQMNCTMDVDIASRTIQNLACK